MSFGPKLDALPAAVPPGAEVVATLRYVPQDASDQKREADIFVEDVNGLRTLSIRTRGAE